MALPEDASTSVDRAAAPPEGPDPAAWTRQLIILWAGGCATIGGATFVFPFLPLMVDTVGVHDPGAIALWSGGLVAITQVALAVFAPLWGRIADRVGRKPMLVRAMIGGGLTFMAAGFAPNIYVLFALRFAQGALAGTISANTALVASTAPRDRVAHSLGVVQSASYVGTTLGPALGAVLVPILGIRAAFGVAGIFPLVAAAGVAFGVHEKFTPPPRIPRPPKATVAIREAGVTRSVVTLVVMALLAQSVGSGLAPALPLRAGALVDHDHAAVGIGAVFALQAGCAAIAALSVSRVARYFGYREILITAALWGGLFYGLLGVASSMPVLLLCAGLGGLAAGSVMPAVNTLLGRVSPAVVRAEVFGYSASSMAVGGAVSPIVSTGLVARYGTGAPFFMVAGIEVALAGWAAVRVRRRVRG
jgi:MFS transporter, DHA1 family, multidrug resistance protein